MAFFSVSNKAKTDLRDIGRYTQQQWGANQRSEYLSALDTCFNKIAGREIGGIDSSEMRAGYRKCYVGKHVVYFRWLNEDHVEIVRVLHQSMEPIRHLV